ncbi:TonB-dependent siderophore receptor [Blastomonas fulva]|jgi:iron complex outermembrane receptor protein|uniref:TonB-dependent siderophore receptor n=1 Tax=Blastomonas fulva TaxID=1550728 RepID=UPI003D2808A4
MKNLVLAAAISTLPAALHAQDGTSDNPDQAPEIIVTAAAVAKLDVPLAETPQNVTVITQEAFERQNATSVEEILRYVPSVQAELSGRSGFDAFLVRGFDQSRYQFRDGLRLDPGFLQQQEPGGLASIEVVKGPASVLFGQIAPGGVVNMTSRVASPDRVAAFSATVGTDDFYRLTADIGGAINSSGTLSARAPIVYASRGDTQDFVGAERIFVAPSVTWEPTEATTLTVLALYQRDDYDRTIGAPLVGTLQPSPAGPIRRSLFLGESALDRLTSEQLQIGYQFSHRFSDAIQFRSHLRYSDLSLEGPIVQAPRGGSTPTSITRRGFNFTGDRKMLSTDNQLEAVFNTGDVEHRVMVGIDYQDFTDRNAGDLFGLAPINPSAPVYGAAPVALGPFFSADVSLKQVGLYAQYRAKIAERFIVVAGARQSDSDTRSTDVLAGTSRTQDDGDTSFNAAIMYVSDAGVSPYVSYSQSFEPQFGFDPLTTGETPPPSQGEQIEAGLRWQSPDKRLSVQAAVFQIDQTNIVNGDPANPGFSVLIGAQRHRGAEIELSGRLGEAFIVQAGYTHLDAKVRASNNGDAGLTSLNVPRNSASMFVTLDGNALGAAGSEGSIGIRHVGSRRANDALDILPAFTVVDAALRHDFGTFGIALNVKNLFDETYFTGGDFRAVFFGERRQVQLTLSAGF